MTSRLLHKDTDLSILSDRITGTLTEIGDDEGDIATVFIDTKTAIY